MSTSTEQRTVEQSTWTCDNCHRQTRAGRKRCTDCGTSRY